MMCVRSKMGVDGVLSKFSCKWQKKSQEGIWRELGAT